jgi:hypothetical protein
VRLVLVVLALVACNRSAPAPAGEAQRAPVGLPAADDRATRCLRAANACAQAAATSDEAALVACTDSRVIDALGGEAAFRKTLAEVRDQFRTQGVVIEQVEVDAPQRLLDGGARLWAVLPTRTRLSLGGKRLESRSALIGSSTDGGQTWRFVDRSDHTLDTMRAMLPDLPASLELPAKVPPRPLP